jgi:hypothetical protein
VTEDRAPTCSLCGSSADVARRWIDTRGNPFLGGKWTSGLLCAACAARQDTPPAELGDPEHLAAAALAELERQVEAGEQSLRAGTQQPPQGQGLWARYGLDRPAYQGLDDLGEPCEICGSGTRPTGPLDWELVECQWCRARVRVHVQCDERVQEAFSQVDCPRCGRVWPDWWELGAARESDRWR